MITLGGNAILPAGGTGTFDEQLSITRATMEPIARLVRDGMTVVLSHGNGPIVGNILIRNEAVRDQIPPMPLDVCGADSQGGIGYMMQQALQNELSRIGHARNVATVLDRRIKDASNAYVERVRKAQREFFQSASAVKSPQQLCTDWFQYAADFAQRSTLFASGPTESSV